MSLFADHNLPFAAALALMALVALVQAVGLGGFELDADGDLDLDLDTDSAAGLTDSFASLAGLGRVPFMIWLASFLLLFATIGYGVQALAAALSGAPFDRWLAATIAALAALPATGAFVRPLARILPKDHTTAVTVETLVGRRATITIGRAAAGYPARAQAFDRHGQPHLVMVEPHDPLAFIGEGEEVLLVRREQGIFYAITLDDQRLAAR